MPAFDYIGFSIATGAVISHAATANTARKNGVMFLDAMTTNAVVVIRCGAAGEYVWGARVSLPRTRLLLESVIVSSPKHRPTLAPVLMAS